MSGGQPGGHKGVTHSRGICPECFRLNVPGGRDKDLAGAVWLRAHKTPDGTKWCSDRRRVKALTERDIGIRFVWGRPVPGAPEPEGEWLKYLQENYGPGCAGPVEPGPDSPTGCPACGSDDYDTEPGLDGQPDYDNGLKTCQGCGERWV